MRAAITEIIASCSTFRAPDRPTRCASKMERPIQSNSASPFRPTHSSARPRPIAQPCNNARAQPSPRLKLSEMNSLPEGWIELLLQLVKDSVERKAVVALHLRRIVDDGQSKRCSAAIGLALTFRPVDKDAFKLLRLSVLIDFRAGQERALNLRIPESKPANHMRARL